VATANVGTASGGGVTSSVVGANTVFKFISNGGTYTV
jgi:hypothetical protein